MTVLDQAWAAWQGASLYAKWRAANPGEAAKLDAYRAGGPRPTLATKTGQALVFETDAWLLEQTPPPPPPDPKVVTDEPGVGINITAAGTIRDGFTVDGTGDSGCIIELGADDSVISNTTMRRVGELPHPSDNRGVHGVYADARNATIDTLKVDCDPSCASAYSLRFDGAKLLNSKGTGAKLLLGIFDSSQVAGQILVDGLTGDCTDDSAVWVAPQTEFRQDVIQTITLRGIKATGPAASKFLAAQAGTITKPVVIEDCFWQGKPVTAADVQGVPANLLTILPAVTPPPPPPSAAKPTFVSPTNGTRQQFTGDEAGHADTTHAEFGARSFVTNAGVPMMRTTIGPSTTAAPTRRGETITSGILNPVGTRWVYRSRFVFPPYTTGGAWGNFIVQQIMWQSLMPPTVALRLTHKNGLPQLDVMLAAGITGGSPAYQYNSKDLPPMIVIPDASDPGVHDVVVAIDWRNDATGRIQTWNSQGGRYVQTVDATGFATLQRSADGSQPATVATKMGPYIFKGSDSTWLDFALEKYDPADLDVLVAS